MINNILGVLLFVWNFWLFGLACVCQGVAVLLSVLAAGVAFFAEMLGDAADALAEKSGSFDELPYD